MTGVRISIEADDALARDALGRMARLGIELQPTLRAIGAALVRSTLQRFEYQRSPAGVPWKRSKRAIEQNGQTLVDSGRLRTSITFRALGNDAVEVGTNVVYAAIHQFGGPIDFAARTGTLRFQGGRFARQRRRKDGTLRPPTSKQRDVNASFGARRLNMPARPYLGLDDNDREDIAEIVARHLRRALANRVRP